MDMTSVYKTSTVGESDKCAETRWRPKDNLTHGIGFRLLQATYSSAHAVTRTRSPKPDIHYPLLFGTSPKKSRRHRPPLPPLQQVSRSLPNPMVSTWSREG